MLKSYTSEIKAEPGKQELWIVREFDAPRERVFRAFTDPDTFVQWSLGPEEMNLSMTIEEFEPRTGGSWRFLQMDGKGNEYGFHGVFHEVSFPERIIQTFEYEPAKGHVSLETSTFEELPDGRTRLTTQSVFQSVEDRDSNLQEGMEKGINDSYTRLDKVLEQMK